MRTVIPSGAKHLRSNIPDPCTAGLLTGCNEGLQTLIF